MKYSVDREKILTKFPKYLLGYETRDEAIAYLLRDELRARDVTFIDYTNRLLVTSFFQDMMDVINPYVGNIYSSFDMDLTDDEIRIQFYADSPKKTREDFTSTMEYQEYINTLDLAKKRKEVTINL